MNGRSANSRTVQAFSEGCGLVTVGAKRGTSICAVSEPTPLMPFPPEFDDEFAFGPEPGNKAFFGRTVLQGLIDGIDDFIRLRERRWHTARSPRPVLLGSAMAIGDEELLGKIGELSAACIVIPKNNAAAGVGGNLERLRALNERTPGIPLRAFWELSEHAPKVGGRPQVVGPYGPMDDFVIPTIRTIGYRRLTHRPPILHAKLALLGDLWWHDEDGSGASGDYLGFTARRLWVSSANFTRASCRSLEFGIWTENADLMDGTRRFLVSLMKYSEPLDPTADDLDPELAPVEFDDEALAEAAAAMEWDEDEYG